ADFGMHQLFHPVQTLGRCVRRLRQPFGPAFGQILLLHVGLRLESGRGQTANISSRATRNEKMPSASANAMPMKRVAICSPAAAGLRSAPERKLPATWPTPMPAPPMPMQARPAPMNWPMLAISPSMCLLLVEWNGWFGLRCRSSVTGMQRVVEIHDREDREDVGLDHGDQHLEGEHADDGGDRDDRADAECPGKAREDLEHRVAGHHVAG